MKKVLLKCGMILPIAFLFVSCDIYKNDTVSYDVLSSPQDCSSVFITSGNENNSPDSDISEILGRTGNVYRIDRDYIKEMNRNCYASNAEKGEILQKYSNQWQDKMNYYYDVLYAALNDDGKNALKSSQENWQKAFNAEMELNKLIQAQNLILYDVFDNPQYTGYRTRAISLYIKCCSMNNLHNSAGNTYTILE